MDVRGDIHTSSIRPENFQPNRWFLSAVRILTEIWFGTRSDVLHWLYRIRSKSETEIELGEKDLCGNFGDKAQGNTAGWRSFSVSERYSVLYCVPRFIQRMEYSPIIIKH